MNEEMELSFNKNIIMIRNEFNFAEINLSALALNIFFLLVSQLHQKKGIEGFELYECTIKELQDKFNTKRIKKELMDAAINELTTLKFNFKINDREINSTLLSIFEYNNSSIRLMLNNEIKDLLLFSHEDGKFTSASLEEFLLLKSVYSKRLYLIFLQLQHNVYKNSKGVMFQKISTIKRILNIKEDQYNNYNNFYKRVLQTALNEIKEHTTLTVYVTKKDRNTDNLIFEIKNIKEIKENIQENRYEKKSVSLTKLVKWSESPLDFKENENISSEYPDLEDIYKRIS